MNLERPGEFIHPPGSLPFVGRDAEQRALREALDLMLRGYGGVMLISGETGIGKTSLLDQIPEMLPEPGAIILTGQSYDIADSPPYGPWRRMFANAGDVSNVSALGDLLADPAQQAPAGSQYEFFESIAGRLRSLSDSAPLLLILEDIHWADRASLDLLRHVSHHASETHLLIVATYRDEAFDRSESLTYLIPRLVRESNTRRVNLRPLDREDILTLLSTRDELGQETSQYLADYLYSRADGNPFFTVELLRELEIRGVLNPDASREQLQILIDIPVPEMVRDVITSRLEHLDQHSIDLLEIAAVLGQRVPIQLWQEVSDASDAALIDTIQQAASLHIAYEHANNGQVRCHHALIRDAIYTRKPMLLRRQQHRRVAEVLCRQADPAPVQIAQHLNLADDPRAVEWLIRAGQQAEDLHAAHDAISSITEAIDLATRHHIDVPANAYCVRGRALETLGDSQSAQQDLHHALALSRYSNDPGGEWRALSHLGMLWAGKDYDQSGKHFDEALAVARTMDDPHALTTSLNRMGNWRANIGELNTAIDLHNQALEIADHDGDAADLLETHDLLGTTNFLAGNYREALEHLEIAISEARRLGDKPQLSSALTMVPMFGGNLDINFEAGIALSRDASYWLNCADEGLRIAQEIGWRAGESYALITLGAVTAARGNLGHSLSLIEQGYAIARDIGHQQWLACASLVLGMVWTEMEDHKRAELYLARGRATAKNLGSHLWNTLAHTYSALLYVKMGDVKRASEFLRTDVGTEQNGRSNAQRSCQLALARWRLAAGDAEAALAYAETLLNIEREPSTNQGVPQVLLIRADSLAALARVADAEQAYRDADRQADLLGLNFIRWRIKSAHSALLLELGDSETASAMANEATRMIQEIALTITDIAVRERFVEQAMSQLPKFGDDRAEYLASSGLSSRERDVLQLTARGLSNAEIGERLFISPRTVAQHLQSIYRKLGVESRTAAAAYAHRHDLT